MTTSELPNILNGGKITCNHKMGVFEEGDNIFPYYVSTCNRCGGQILGHDLGKKPKPDPKKNKELELYEMSRYYNKNV